MKLVALLTILVLSYISMLSFVSPTAAAAPVRPINIYVLNIPTAQNAWVTSRDQVYQGVQAAVNDAVTNTKVKLSGETINLQTIASEDMLYIMAMRAPDYAHSIFINAHGEVLPIPDKYSVSATITSPSQGATVSGIFSVYATAKPLVDVMVYSWIDNSQMILMSYQSQYNRFWLQWSTGSFPDGWHTIYVMAIRPSSGLSYTTSISVYMETPTSGGGGGGGCPYLYAWNGSHYVVENNILPAGYYGEEKRGYNSTPNTYSDVWDYVLIQNPSTLKGVTGSRFYSFTINEYMRERTWLDYVNLVAVDHEAGVNIGVETTSGNILTYSKAPFAPTSAVDEAGNSTLSEIRYAGDGSSYQGHEGGCVTLTFLPVDTTLGAKLIVRADPPPTKVSIYVQIQDPRQPGDWITIGKLHPRVLWSTDVLDMKPYLDDFNLMAHGEGSQQGQLEVRLFFTAQHKVDYVALDTTAQSPVNLHDGLLVQATHEVMGEDSNVKSALGEDGDQRYVALQPCERVKLTFEVHPMTPQDSGWTRDLVFVSRGHYTTLPQPVCLEDDPPYWQGWIDKIAQNCKQYGWIWVNVAGYSFYYMGNTNYWSDTQNIGAQGLQRFLGDASASASGPDDVLEKWSLNDVGFSSYGFNSIYTRLPESLAKGSRPISMSSPPIDLIGYHGKTDYKWYSAAFPMNGPDPGIYVHNGLASNAANGVVDVDGNGVIDSRDDDWLKGYTATAIAIEEARSHLMETTVSTQFVFGGGPFDTKPHAAGFSVTMVPGSYKQGDRLDENNIIRSYRSVDLRISMRNHFEKQYTTGFDGITNYFLTLGDFRAYSKVGGDVEFLISTQLSGLQTGGTSTSLMDGLYWSALAKLAGAVSGTLGLIVGSIPTIIQYFGPQAFIGTTRSGSIIYANGTNVDQDGDGWATISFEVTAYFYRGSLVSYSLCAGMASWVGCQGPTPVTVNCFRSLQFSQDLSFDVSW